MPTLDVRGEVVDAGLIVNYHSSRRPDVLQKKFLTESLNLARTILAHHVLPALNVAEGKLTSAASLKIAPDLDKTLLAILRTHFRLPEFSGAYTPAMLKNDIRTIKNIYMRVNTGVSVQMTISDSYSAVAAGRKSEPARGYVRWKASAIGFLDPITGDLPPGFKVPTAHRGSVHIDFGMLKASHVSSKLTVARTIIHESSHKFGLTEDKSYRYYTDYKDLTKADAMDNADSYAYAAVSIYKKKPITQMEDNLLEL